MKSPKAYAASATVLSEVLAMRPKAMRVEFSTVELGIPFHTVFTPLGHWGFSERALTIDYVASETDFVKPAGSAQTRVRISSVLKPTNRGRRAKPGQKATRSKRPVDMSKKPK